MLKRLAKESTQIKESKYIKYSIARLVFIAIGFAVSIFFFYILRQQSLIFCAGIAAIGIYFCKPTAERISYELSWTENKQENQDIYIVISANEYELARCEKCFDVQNCKYREFKTYDSFRKFILKSREKRDNAIPQKRKE
jgi:hypothetical protein